MTKKNKNQNSEKILDKEQIQQIFNSKLKEAEKEEIRIYIDKNIGLLKYRFCPHEFFKLVAKYQDKFFSKKLRKKIKRKYKKSKFDTIGYKYPDLYEEYFYKSLYFMYYFKSNVGRSYFNTTAKKLFDEYKFGYDLNFQNRLDTFKYLSTFVGGLLTMVIPTWINNNKLFSGDFIFFIAVLIIFVTNYNLAKNLEDNAYDSRLFTKLLQDEFDNKKK